ncbi:MAG TPA: porin [Gemmatimonadaceae bacterium]|nr:porin [Gemmatimonadaceae bacterium]
MLSFRLFTTSVVALLCSVAAVRADAQGAPDSLASPVPRPRPAVTADSTKQPSPPAPQAQPAATRHWYDRISLRGYAQLRYNRLLETNKNLVCSQCDRSIGNNGGIFLRRGRLILSGDVHPRVSIYIQPDYGSDAAGTLHYLQLRDAYFDLNLDTKKEHRLRIGQSKVPFGFENLQSSSNRIPLDRNDGLNSAVPNERDMGVFYYWASVKARARFKMLVDSGLKGSGDYGVFGFGVMNGQTANRPEANNSLHTVMRLTYPWRLPNGQFVEAGIQGYNGRFVLPSKSANVRALPEYQDDRVAVSFVWYAQPFGLVAEYNWGKGPEFVASTRSIDDRSLQGGFVQSMYRWQTHGQVIQPFARLHTYHGGKKVEQDARHYEVHEIEAGVEWLPFSNFELTAQYTSSDRVFEDAATIGNRQKGQFLRLQAQFNY